MKNETIKIIRKMELTAFVIVLAIFTYLLKQSKKMIEEKRYKGEIIAKEEEIQILVQSLVKSAWD